MSNFTKIAQEFHATKKKLLNTIKVFGLDGIDENFADQGTPSGTKWKDIKDSTKKARKGEGGDEKILQDSGLLRAGVIGKYKTAKSHVLWGLPESLKYGEYNHFGTSTIDARPFMGFNSKTEKKMVKAAKEFLQDIVDKHKVK